jgi:Leucine-rich repeat (LRR) protein
MKKLLLILLCLPMIGLGQQMTYVPDDNFEQRLITLGYDNILDDYVLTSNINTMQSLVVAFESILDLTGIEDFISLTHLWCNHNNLVSLDVSNLTNLTNLNCQGNNITSLDVSNNTALTYLWCGYNPSLTSLNVSGATALEFLECDENFQISSLDVSNNTALATLWCYHNNLTSLDVSNNTALVSLSCTRNQLTSLDVSNNTALDSLKCSRNQLTSLDVSNNTALVNLWCHSNQLTSLNVRNGNNMNMTNSLSKFYNNPQLFCIDVDNVAWSTANWTHIDAWVSFSTNCATALGCTDSLACNYDSLATIDDGSCVYPIIWQQAFSICNGDSIVVGSNIYTSSGNYTDTLSSLNGCDTIMYTNINVIQPIVWQQAFSICNGDSIVIGSNIYTSSGNYTDTLNASNGCDSIVYTNIGVASPIIWQQAFSICNGDSIVVGSNIYTSSGNYTDTLSSLNGCDTIMYTNILANNNSYSFDTLVASVSIVWNGIPLSVSGDYSITLINAVGCDSIVNLNLTITNSTSVEENNNNKELIKITNVLGQETPYRKNTPLFYIYNDGTVEKKIIIE